MSRPCQASTDCDTAEDRLGFFYTHSECMERSWIGEPPPSQVRGRVGFGIRFAAGSLRGQLDRSRSLAVQFSFLRWFVLML